MKYSLIAFLLLSATVYGQMEKRLEVLYDRSAFRKRAPAIGKKLADLTLRDLKGKKVTLSSLRRKKPLVIIGGAYT